MYNQVKVIFDDTTFRFDLHVSNQKAEAHLETPSSVCCVGLTDMTVEASQAYHNRFLSTCIL